MPTAHNSPDTPVADSLPSRDVAQIEENLHLILSRLTPWNEASISQLSELSDALCNEAGYDAQSLLSLLRAMQDDGKHAASIYRSDKSTADHAYIDSMTQSLGLHHRLLLYHFLCDRLFEDFDLTCRTSRDVTADAKGRIAYMDSPLAHEAYLFFAGHVPACRAANFHSFADVCEEVSNGLCQYCILPLHTSTDGQLMGFFRLMTKYRLQIVAAHSIQHTQNGLPCESTFALLRSMGEAWDIADVLSNPFLANLPSVRATPSSLCLSVLFTPHLPSDTGELLCAATHCGVPLLCASSLPYGELSALLYGISPDEDISVPAKHGFYLSFDVGAMLSPHETATSMPQAFLMYLTLDAERSDSVLLGLYPHF